MPVSDSALHVLHTKFLINFILANRGTRRKSFGATRCVSFQCVGVCGKGRGSGVCGKLLLFGILKIPKALRWRILNFAPLFARLKSLSLKPYFLARPKTFTCVCVVAAKNIVNCI